jgi:maspardin
MKRSKVLSKSEEYKRFRSWVSLQKICVHLFSEKDWVYYDFGPKECVPLVCIPGITGTPDVFYKQILSLCPKGYRIIAVESPPYTTYERWLKGFDRFLDALKISKVHLFGAAFGGYLAQCYVQYRPNRVESLILCTSFCDTQYYIDNAPFARFFPWMPEFMLKKMLLSNLPQHDVEAAIADSIDFVVEQLEGVSHKELAAKMILNCTSGPLKPQEFPLPSEKITIIDVMDEVAVPAKLREELQKFYPNARLGLLKSGGNFPYLSRADEVNMLIEVHLRNNGYIRGGGFESSPSVEQTSLASQSNTSGNNTNTNTSINNPNENANNNTTNINNDKNAADNREKTEVNDHSKDE